MEIKLILEYLLLYYCFLLNFRFQTHEVQKDVFLEARRASYGRTSTTIPHFRAFHYLAQVSFLQTNRSHSQPHPRRNRPYLPQSPQNSHAIFRLQASTHPRPRASRLPPPPTHSRTVERPYSPRAYSSLPPHLHRQKDCCHFPPPTLPQARSQTQESPPGKALAKCDQTKLQR